MALSVYLIYQMHALDIARVEKLSAQCILTSSDFAVATHRFSPLIVPCHSQLSTDSKIGKFWTGMSAREAREQAEIVLEVAFGEGPNGLSPDDARYIHDSGRGMKENDFDNFLKCVKETLKEINKQANIIPTEKVNEAIDNFNKFKKSFVK